MIVDKRYRDISIAQNKKIEKLNSISKDFLINHGIKCLLKYGNLYRRNYDKYAKENKTLTYIPVANRFGGFSYFINEVESKLNKVNLPI